MSAKLNKGLSEVKTVLDKFVSLMVYATFTPQTKPLLFISAKIFQLD